VPPILECAYVPRKQDQFFTIGIDNGGYQLMASYIKPVEVDLSLNYGSEFPEVYQKIIDRMKNDKHGLFILHGDSGTGKTTLIRKIINELSEDKNLIYVPSYMMEGLADPNLISFIAKFKGSILILEDSENIISSKFENRQQAVTNILNMSDGLLNDHLDLQIITTFNIKSANEMDPALMRAGRMIVNYEFKPLSSEQANQLCEHLNNGKTFDKPVTLAEIYEGHNQITNVSSTRKKIGF